MSAPSSLDRRSAGVAVPLFSIPSEASWGVGELPDLERFSRWMERARLGVLALLPLNECALGQESPYSALSAFAIDPLYLSLDHIEEFRELGGEAALSGDERRRLAEVRASGSIQHAAIRALKRASLLRCFDRFEEAGGAAGSSRAQAFARFVDEQRFWLEDYALFRAMKETAPSWWPDWPQPIRDRDEAALAEAKTRLARWVRFFEYLQWQAHEQLAAARREARGRGVSFLGDFPFTVGEDSADVWSRQGDFSLAATVGSPPDPYASEGQDWGLPAYRWRKVGAAGYPWLRARAGQAATLFDGARVDHVVGFYRTYVHPKDGGVPHFDPSEEGAQRHQGEAILDALREEGLRIVAEDLGTIPDFVRLSLSALAVPGYRVLRWEKDDGVFRDPLHWPQISLATTGTHDTETLAQWFEALDPGEREAFLSIPSLDASRFEPEPSLGPGGHQAILDLIYRSRSDLLLLPFQDIFASKDRINVPGTVAPTNWTYRIPWSTETLLTDPSVRLQTDRLAALATATGRLGFAHPDERLQIDDEGP